MGRTFSPPVHDWHRIPWRFAAKRVIAPGYGILGIGFALNAIGDRLAVLILSMTLFTIGERIAMPMQSAWVARIAPREMRGCR